MVLKIQVNGKNTMTGKTAIFMGCQTCMKIYFSWISTHFNGGEYRLCSIFLVHKKLVQDHEFHKINVIFMAMKMKAIGFFVAFT